MAYFYLWTTEVIFFSDKSCGRLHNCGVRLTCLRPLASEIVETISTGLQQSLATHFCLMGQGRDNFPCTKMFRQLWTGGLPFLLTKLSSKADVSRASCISCRIRLQHRSTTVFASLCCLLNQCRDNFL